MADESAKPSVSAPTFSVGYVPASFPRDPIEINQFLEHMFLGQILEPLVDSDKYGQVIGGVAKAWTFSHDAKQILFKIDLTRKFSNGRHVSAADAVYSIGRHLKTHSQSAQFLADIESVHAQSQDEVLVQLKTANVAVIKALSRDQLGIVPDGWKFAPDSAEPYIGTGPYRLIRIGENWELVENPNYPHRESVGVKKWNITFLKSGLEGIPDDTIPDYIPAVTPPTLRRIKANPQFSLEKFEVKQNVSYSQTSFWVFPTSPFFKSATRRHHLALLLDQALADYTKKHNLERATGLIPIGISGHNSAAPKLEGEIGQIGGTLRVACLRGVFEDFFQSPELSTLANAHDLQVELVPFDPPQLLELRHKAIDVITGSWAGGYSDPTGFLGLLTPMLGMEFGTYLGENAKLLTAAKEEQDWSRRAEKFRAFDRSLVTSALIVPGWQTPTYTIIRRSLHYRETQSRYTERFVNVSDH